MNVTNTPLLETERLILRRFSEDDLNALFKIYSEEEINTYLPWLPLQSIAEAGTFLQERYIDAYKLPRGYQYAICLKTDNIPIGYINVSTEENHDLGYGLLKEFWHKGIVTEGSKAVVKQLKRDGIPYITATHDIENPRSGGVMRQLGMRYQYSYEEQWQPKNIPVIFRMYQLNLDGENKRVYKEYWDRSSVRFVEKDME